MVVSGVQQRRLSEADGEFGCDIHGIPSRLSLLYKDDKEETFTDP